MASRHLGTGIAMLMRKLKPKERAREAAAIAQQRADWLREIDELESYYADLFRRNFKRWCHTSSITLSVDYGLLAAISDVQRTLPVAREKAQTDSWSPSSELSAIRRWHVEVTTELQRDKEAKHRRASAKGVEEKIKLGRKTREKVEKMARALQPRYSKDAIIHKVVKTLKVSERTARDYYPK
jgi:hypothetical protein